MNRFNFIVLFLILPVIMGKSTVVINRIINDKEIPLNKSNVEASWGKVLKFSCYVNVTLGNKTYRHNNVNWQTPGYTEHVKNHGNVFIIDGVNMIHRGRYVCVNQEFHIPIQYRDFYLEVGDQPKPIDYNKVQIPEFASIDNEHRAWPDLSKVPEIKLADLIKQTNSVNHSNNPRDILIFFGGALMLIVGFGIMYHQCRNSCKSRSSANCNHDLCNQRRGTDPLTVCLLQEPDS